MKSLKIKRDASEFLPSALEIIEKPSSPLGKLIIWMISLLLGSVIVWTVVSEVDEVAIAQGQVIPDGHIKVIQSLEGGVITAIHAEEGQHVQKGQLLIELDTDLNLADLEKQKIALETAIVERRFLKALLEEDKATVETLLQEREEWLIETDLVELLNRFKELRKLTYIEQQEAYEINTRKSEEELNMARQVLEESEKEATFLKKQVDLQEKLLDGGATSQKTYDDALYDYEMAEQAAELQKTKIAYYESQLQLTSTQKTNHTMEFYQEVMDELLTKDKTIMQLEKDIAKLEKQLEFQQIVSPVDGVIQGMGANTVGGVITSANPIVTIVPDSTPLTIEAYVLNKDIGFVELSQEVDIKLDAFPYQKYGTLSGEVVYISPDAVEDDTLGYVYKMKVKPLTDRIQVDRKQMTLTSGMTVVTEIKTDKRRVAEFFLPAVKHIKDNFRLR